MERKKKIKKAIFKVEDKAFQIVEAYALTTTVVLGIAGIFIIKATKNRKKKLKHKIKDKFNG